MRFAVEAWAPEYGAPLQSTEAEDAAAPDVDAAVEAASGEWQPIRPSDAQRPGRVRFIDGVRRIDARLWITAADGATHPGIAASYAAGSVCCDAVSVKPTLSRGAPGAWLERAEVRRVVVSPAADLVAVDTAHGRFEPRHVHGDGDEALSQGLQQAMASLEHLVTVAAEPVDLTIVDGLLSKLPKLGETVGYVKTRHRRYLPADLDAVVTRLDTGERTPLFRTLARWERWSWYLRLPTAAPGRDAHPLSGVVRCELAGDVPLARARALADTVAATLPRFASQPHRDPRAPQNLTPIGALEQALRHRLGDPHLVQRGLRAAATAGHAAAGPG